MKLKPGQLVLIKTPGLEISGGDSKPTLPVDVGSVLMFVKETTYFGALKEAGHSFSEIPEAQIYYKKNEPFMVLLFGEEILYLPVSEADEFFEIKTA